MNHIRRITAMLTALAAILTFGAASSAAWATRVPPLGGPGEPAQAPPLIHIIVTGGMPGWQITLIAIATALLAAVLAVFLDRAREARRHTTAPSA